MSVKDDLAARGLKPKRSFGQNFLLHGPTLDRIAGAAVLEQEVSRAEVIEIGAGTGALTEALRARAASVVAIERDRDLVPLLSERFADDPRVRVLEADAQSVDFASLFGTSGGPRVLCGNLPYQITKQLIEKASKSAGAFDRAVFMVQREVADRLAASPSSKEYGALTVFTHAAFSVSRVMDVAPSSFFPPPDVWSSVIALVPQRPPRAEETEMFRRVVKGAFLQRRKTLRNAWRSLGASPEVLKRAADAAGINLDARGETLTVDEFARMADVLSRA